MNSSTRRSKSKRKSIELKTPIQSNKVFTNIGFRNDWDFPFPIFKNDLYNSRTHVDGTRDYMNRPTSDDWNMHVIQDWSFSEPLASELDAEYQYLWDVTGIYKEPGGRWPVGSFSNAKVTVRDPSDIFPFQLVSNHLTISDVYQDGVDYYFKITFQGNTPILKPNPGSKGWVNFLLPAYGHTLDDLYEGYENDTSLYTDIYLDFHKQYEGFRLMGFSNTNGAAWGGGIKMNQALVQETGIWSLRRILGVNEYSVQPTDYKDRFNYWVNPYIDITLQIHFINSLKKRKGSRVKKAWFTLPGGILAAWGMDKYYGTKEDPNTNTLVIDESVIIAECDPMFAMLPEDQAETTYTGGLGAEYVYNYVETILNNLDPSIEVVFEYSNETWNYGYSQANMTFTKSSLATDDETKPFNYPNIFLSYDGSFDLNYRRARMMAYAAMRISQIAKARFALHPERKMCEVGIWGQQYQTYTGFKAFDYVDHFTNNYIEEYNTRVIDSVGFASYSVPVNYLSKTPDGYFDAIQADSEYLVHRKRGAESSYDMLRGISAWVEYCKAKNVKCVVYEWGWDTMVDLTSRVGSQNSRSYIDHQYWYPILIDQEKSNLLMKKIMSYLYSSGVDEAWAFLGVAGKWNWDYFSFALTSSSFENKIDLQPPLIAFRNIADSLPDDQEINHVLWNPLSGVIGEESFLQSASATVKPSNGTMFFGPNADKYYLHCNVYPDSMADELTREELKTITSNQWFGNGSFYISAYIPKEGTYKMVPELYGGNALKSQNILDPNGSLITKTKYLFANEIVAGKYYRVMSVGDTDFTQIGASSNLINALFTATGPGSGSGFVSDVTSVSGDSFSNGGAKYVISVSNHAENNLPQQWVEIANVPFNGWTASTIWAVGEEFQHYFKRGWYTFKITITIPSDLCKQGESGNIRYTTSSTSYKEAYDIDRDNDPASVTYSTSEIISAYNTLNTSYATVDTPLSITVETGKNYQYNDSVYLRDLNSQKWIDGKDVTSEILSEYRTIFAKVKSYDSLTGVLELYALKAGYYSYTDPVTQLPLPTTTNNWEIGKCYYEVSSNGSGYTPNTTFGPDGYICSNITAIVSAPDYPDGTNAEVVPISFDEQNGITQLFVTNSGSGYTKPATVTFIDNVGSGTGAKKIAVPHSVLTVLSTSALYRKRNFKYSQIPFKNYAYAKDILGGTIYDPSGNPVVISEIGNMTQTGFNGLKITRIS